MKTTLGIGCILLLGAFIIGIALWTLLIMGVWNFLVVPVFHTGTIDWPQAFVVAVIASIIQSSIAGSRSNG